MICEVLIAGTASSYEDVIFLRIKTWDKRAQKALGSAKFGLGNNKEDFLSHLEKVALLLYFIKMRVLILTTQYLPHIGGSELAIYNLTKRLPDIQFDIVTSKNWKWFLPITGFFTGLRHHYDVVHVFQASYAGGAGVLLKLFRPRVPLIVTLQEGKDLARQSFFVRFFRHMILRKADVITAISTYLLEYGKKINPKAKFYLLPNGVTISPLPPLIYKRWSKGGVVSVSRLVNKNGLDILIRAIPLLNQYSLLLAGSGPLEAELKKLAQSLGVTDRVTFLGTVGQDALPGILERSSVFVRPSRSEGMGIAFLEAMAVGVPIVATPVGGIPDFLKDRETGLFCEVDNPDSIARCVMMLENDKELRARIIQNALALVQEKYNWDILAKQYHEIIRSHSRI